MRTNKLLVAAVLVTTIGAPIAGSAGDINVPQPITLPGLPVLFLHGFGSSQIPSEPELPAIERANEWLNSPPLTAPALRGKVVLIEGSYEQSEMIIQALLAEAGTRGIDRQPVSVDARGIEAAADWGSLKSSENYVGYERTQNFASPGGAVLGNPRIYQLPPMLRLNEWALSGDWTVMKESAVLNKPKGGITYGFHARDLHLVMGLAAPGASVRFRVLIDGRPPGPAGIDVDEQGNGTVTEQRLYQLIRQPKPVGDRRFEIEFLDPGVEAFAFTFG